jgi:hypothetical protein
MPRVRTIPGRLARFEEPEWQLLIDLIGLELVPWFMLMHGVELADDTRVRAYKHRATRRYLHLGEDGRAFAYVPRDRYREITLVEALEEAFFEWEYVFPEPDAAAVAALDDLMRRVRGDTHVG